MVNTHLDMNSLLMKDKREDSVILNEVSNLFPLHQYHKYHMKYFSFRSLGLIVALEFKLSWYMETSNIIQLCVTRIVKVGSWSLIFIKRSLIITNHHWSSSESDQASDIYLLSAVNWKWMNLEKCSVHVSFKHCVVFVSYELVSNCYLLNTLVTLLYSRQFSKQILMTNLQQFFTLIHRPTQAF